MDTTSHRRPRSLGGAIGSLIGDRPIPARAAGSRLSQEDIATIGDRIAANLMHLRAELGGE
jgi:hypothetical protein